MSDMVVTPIGRVINGFDVKPEGGWKDTVSEIVIDADYERGLDGLEQFSHITVLFWLDRVTKDKVQMTAHPRGLRELPEVGVFATRSPHRPNPIGVTIVKLVGRDGCRLQVCGLDALDGTPVVDIKGCTSLHDIDDFQIPDWARFISKLPY